LIVGSKREKGAAAAAGKENEEEKVVKRSRAENKALKKEALARLRGKE
jgi:hypothetical protein